MTKGVFLIFNNSILSKVYYSKPCIISMTKIAISHKLLPLLLKLLKLSWPGVSMTNSPGTSTSTG
jgi:hypothetical protein